MSLRQGMCIEIIVMDDENRWNKTFIQKNTVDFCEVHALERTKT